MRDFILNLMFFAGMIALIIIVFAVASEVDAWERANSFPFGKLCEVYNNCKQ